MNEQLITNQPSNPNAPFIPNPPFNQNPGNPNSPFNQNPGNPNPPFNEPNSPNPNGPNTPNFNGQNPFTPNFPFDPQNPFPPNPPFNPDSSLIESDPFVTGNVEVRSIDGTGNNLENPDYGAADTALLDTAPVAFSDGISAPAGTDRPNAREVSNTISAQSEDTPDPRGLTNLTWAFGQFLDHDLSLTPEDADADPIVIPVPAGDPFFDPAGTGDAVITLSASQTVEGTGTDPSNPQLLPNDITSFLDLSNVYGSDEERTDFLRSFEGGKLKVSEGELLPFNDGTVEENANPFGLDPTSLYVAGDVRANENSVLTSMHTLFVREHNRLADALSQEHPEWTDEQVFQQAREINIAQWQSIVYNEYLPTLLGEDALSDYTGYDPTTNPGIDRTFSTAAFRLGHTQLSSDILRLDPTGEVIPEGNSTLAEIFFPGGDTLQEVGIDPFIRGVASSSAQQIDNQVIDDVRNLLFGDPSEPGTTRDLAAINIERGRVEGVADYNTIRETYGLPRVTSFAEITSDPELQANLEQLYGSVDDIDAFVGLLAEDHVSGGSVGETIRVVLSDQFERLRDGDRFYYENIFNPQEIAELDNTTLADLIRRNTDTTVIQDNAFTLLNEGTNQDDILNGGLGSDTIMGMGGNDRIRGYAADDVLTGNQGADRIDGGAGSDDINGGQGEDRLFGNTEADEIRGDRGNDFIAGGKGNDLLEGGQGNDRLSGDMGDDTLIGGRGADRFHFGRPGFEFSALGTDTIADFSNQDSLLLSRDTFTALPTGSNLLTSFAIVDSPEAAGTVSAAIVYEQQTGSLYYNPDGETPGLENGGQFAQLTPGQNLSADNFTIV